MGIYFQPETAAIGIIDEIVTALSKVDPDSPLILAGGLNYRIDAPAVLEYLEETRLKLINQDAQATYIAHNGSSCIDLVFSNTKFDSPAQQRIISNPTRKHLLVETVFRTPSGRQQEPHNRPERETPRNCTRKIS